MNAAPQKIVFAYHEQTKHHLTHYAQGPQHIDWQAQPHPFRHYLEVPHFELPLVADTLTLPYVQLSQPHAGQALNLTNLAALLELSLGLSAYKRYGSAHWALRCNPSSGNLHPTEAYLILPPLSPLAAGVYHYESYDHLLEQRGIIDLEHVQNFEHMFPTGSFLIGLTSIPWREAWKYGERAFRYCQHDLGHALAALRYAAAVLGWSAQLLTDWSDEEMNCALGLHRKEDFYPNEREIPEGIVWIKTLETTLPSPQTLGQESKTIHWQGQANLLDPQHHYQWPLIDEIIEATQKRGTFEPAPWVFSQRSSQIPWVCSHRAVDLIRQRRSAQQFDGRTVLSLEAFYHLLESTLPDQIPWDIFPYPPRLHLVLFVHRVATLPAGLYLLLRHSQAETELRQTLRHKEFEWVKPDSCSNHMSFYRLMTTSTEEIAQHISCHQEIAAESAFSLGMLAEFTKALEYGPWSYRELFWEAGIIGQVLYLEAEAVGARGTGIGCYFDDAFHRLLGLSDTRYQSLYHFTVGYPLHDPRIQTLPPYAHLGDRALT